MKILFIVCLLLMLSTALAGETESKEPTQAELQAAAEAQSKTRDFVPSTEIADKAFSKGDYKTALKHYKALGEEGDGRASMAAGLIYADGAEGIEADKGKAAAWFERSGDQGETVGVDLYEKMDNKNELNAEEKIEAKNLIHEFRESDAKLTRGQQTLITDPYLSDAYSSGTSSSISGIGSRQYTGKSDFVQTSSANITIR